MDKCKACQRLSILGRDDGGNSRCYSLCGVVDDGYRR